MEERAEIDVLICGAGAAGLTLAIELARRGIAFRLIDKMDDAFRGSRGKGLQPRTLEVFEDLGIIDRIAAAGGPYPPQREYREDGTFAESAIAEIEEPRTGEPYRTPLMIPQFLTEGVMRERLAEFGHSVMFGYELIGFEQDDEGVTARLAGQAGEEVVRSRYLVGTDGGRSFVRHALGIDFPGKTLGVRALVADVALTGLDRDAWHRFNEGDMQRQIAICPLAGTDLFQIQGPIPLEGDIDLSAEGLSLLVSERTGRDIRVQSVSWASAFNMNARLADRYRVGRAFLAGDAAHTHPPTGGQGLNTSVQDAYNLGWKLATVLRGGPASLLDSYEEERRPIAAEMLGLATRLLDAMKRGETRRGRDTHQLDLGYSESPLSYDGSTSAIGPLAGDRMPDAMLTGAAGQPRRLFDILTGPHWTLLVSQSGYTPAADAREGVRVVTIGQGVELRDPSNQLGLADGSALLIRPDGYVGATFDAPRLGAISDYFVKVLPPTNA
jgi:2-polyprenyl-6-methoxyphenol hydroxylase-like FAD-dependent oxidoreductase